MRAVKESDIDKYLTQRVRRIGGFIRPLRWRCLKNAPDKFISFCGPHFVELKRPGEKPRPEQDREFQRMRDTGTPVWVLSTKDEVDHFIKFLQELTR